MVHSFNQGESRWKRVPPPLRAADLEGDRDGGVVIEEILVPELVEVERGLSLWTSSSHCEIDVSGRAPISTPGRRL